MSDESRDIFYQALNDYAPGDDPAELRAAAAGHLGASRSLDVLMAEYAAALEGDTSPGQHAVAQRIADEMAPVSLATRVAAGLLPGSSTTAGG